MKRDVVWCGALAGLLAFSSVLCADQLVDGRTAAVEMSRIGGGAETTMTSVDTRDGFASGVADERPVVLDDDEGAPDGPGQPPGASARPACVIFGPVKKGMTIERSVRVRNMGSADLAVSRVAISGRNGAEFKAVNPCVTPISPSKACLLPVSLKADSYGRKMAQLLIYSNDPGTVTVVPLSANAIAPKPAVTPSALKFPAVSVGATNTKPLLIRNVGLSDMTSLVEIKGPHARDFSISGTCATLEAGVPCEVQVVFGPGGKGKRTARIEITSEESQRRKKSLIVTLAGRGK